MNLAFAYFPPDYRTDHPYVVGRHVGTESFFRAYLRHARPDPVYCYAPRADHYREFVRQVADLTGASARTEWVPVTATPRLAAAGALFRSDPRIAELAWVRRGAGGRAFSVVGVVHSLVDHSILDGTGAIVIAPVESWDAVVCTSRAARAFMERIFSGYREYLEQRFGTALPPSPVQLPIIPVGVDCQAFARTPEREAAGHALRQRLGIGREEVVALCLGRISNLDKAHPLPMYAGLEMAARATGRTIHLLQVGLFAHEGMRPWFLNAARVLCHLVKVHFIDSREAAVRTAAWAAADFFTSLADNVQETFGLAPVEAMAAGLPVVVSDWDGYRDTVVHGEVGFRVPVLLPPPGAGEEIARGYEFGGLDYGRYIGSIGACTAVDLRACSEAYATLVSQPELRHTMGAAASRRATAHYDWPVVIGQYQELLRELAKRRHQDRESCPRPPGVPANPLRPDPFWLYQDFPTAGLALNDRVGVVADAIRSLPELAQDPMNAPFMGLFPAVEQLKAMLEAAKAEPATVAQWLASRPNEQRQHVFRGLLWLLKMGLLDRQAGTGLPECHLPRTSQPTSGRIMP